MATIHITLIALTPSDIKSRPAKKQKKFTNHLWLNSERALLKKINVLVRNVKNMSHLRIRRRHMRGMSLKNE